jgi:hypothetical protein
MKKGLWSILLLFVWVAGCGTSTNTEETGGKDAPVITASFASKELTPGDTWKIYLQASDPNGDMDYIACTVFQPGKGDYSPGFIEIEGGNSKELSGYIYLNTLSSEGTGWMNSLNVTLTVQIKDMDGHYSGPVHFPLAFNDLFAQEPPPAGVFKEEDLGPIMIELSPYNLS